MDPWVQSVVVAIMSVVASSGFWAYLMKRDLKKTAISRLLLGLAYDKIVTLGVAYIERGWISKDEYEEFRKYLYEPYKDFGGNGVADRIMEEVSHLPLRSPNRYVEINQTLRRTGRENDEQQRSSAA